MITRSQWIVVNIVLISLMFLYLKFSLRTLDHINNDLSTKASFLATSSAIILYNRVPKTGSTTFVNAIMYDLCKVNNFSVLHLNFTRNRYIMNLADQSRFVENITTWKERLPVIYHGHAAFVDFTLFGKPNPIYINMVREPFERLLSHYYFLRYGDDYRVGLKRSRAGNNETFDDCYERNGKDCDMKQMWMQIPYFCGTAFFCSEPGNERALELAKKNLIEHYLLVGITERMRDFVAALEVILPSFFRGALEYFESLDAKRSHLRYTKKKVAPSEKTIAAVKSQKIYKMEYEFYKFAISAFNSNTKRLMDSDGKNFLPPQFHYEKIKPWLGEVH